MGWLCFESFDFSKIPLTCMLNGETVPPNKDFYIYENIKLKSGGIILYCKIKYHVQFIVLQRCCYIWYYTNLQCVTFRKFRKHLQYMWSDSDYK